MYCQANANTPLSATPPVISPITYSCQWPNLIISKTVGLTNGTCIDYMSGGGVFLSNLVFQACISFLRWFRTSGSPIRKIYCILECYPVLSLNGLKLCKSVSRSDLVLDADH